MTYLDNFKTTTSFKYDFKQQTVIDEFECIWMNNQQKAFYFKYTSFKDIAYDVSLRMLSLWNDGFLRNKFMLGNSTLSYLYSR